MIRMFIIAFTFCFSNTFAQPIAALQAGGRMAKSTQTATNAGVLLDYNFNASTFSTDWTKTGTGASSFSISSSKLVITGGSGNSNVSEYLTCNLVPATTSDSWDIYFEMTVQSYAGLLGVGILSVNTPIPYSCLGTFETNTGLCYFGNVNSSNVYSSGKSSSPESIGYSLNTDLISCHVAKRNYTYIVSWRNLTTNAGYTNLQYEQGTDGNITNNSGKFIIAAFNSSVTISKFIISTQNLQSPDFSVIGNSITAGANADYINARYFNLLANNSSFVKMNNYSGSGNTTTGMLSSVREIINANPSNVVISTGTNDVAFSTIGTFSTNYNRFIDSIKTNLPNTNIYCNSILPRQDLDVRVFNDTIKAIAYRKSCYYINSFNYLKADTSLFRPNAAYIPYSGAGGDGLHPNNAGHTALANFIYNYTPYKIFSNPLDTVSGSNFNQNTIYNCIAFFDFNKLSGNNGDAVFDLFDSTKMIRGLQPTTSRRPKVLVSSGKKSLQFDGSAAKFLTLSNFSKSNKYTFAFSVYNTTITGVTADILYTLVELPRITLTETGQIIAYWVVGGNSFVAQTTTGLTNNKKSRIIIQFDGSDNSTNQITIYVDGVKQTVTTIGTPNTTNAFIFRELVFGGRTITAGSGNVIFYGFGAWADKLNAQQVADIDRWLNFVSR